MLVVALSLLLLSSLMFVSVEIVVCVVELKATTVVEMEPSVHSPASSHRCDFDYAMASVEVKRLNLPEVQLRSPGLGLGGQRNQRGWLLNHCSVQARPLKIAAAPPMPGRE